VSQGVFYRFSNPAGVGKGESMPFCLPERRKIHVGRLRNFIDYSQFFKRNSRFSDAPI
jgi:hypothetical protein